MTYPPSPPPPLPRPVSPLTPPPRRLWVGALGWVMFICLVALIFLLASQRRAPAGPRIPHTGVPIPLSEFTSRLQANQVRAVVVSRDEVLGEFVTPQSLPDSPTAATYFRTPLPDGLGDSWPFLEWTLSHRGAATVSVEPSANNLLTNILLPLIPWLLIFAFIWFFVFRALRNQSRIQQAVITGPGRWVPDPPP